MSAPDALIIGAGPAGLMAAQVLAEAGQRVMIADQMPSVARKFLMAGKSGLNLTKNEGLDTFLAAYEAPPLLREAVAAFGPPQVRAWAKGLGQELFAGSTGRVFPRVMKASPLLRAWLKHLSALGVEVNTRWRWTGWQGADALFETPDGARSIAARITILACGGASWPRLGSDGAWAEHLDDTAPFRPSNAALRVAWSAPMQKHFGSPLKAIALRAGDHVSRGEAVISATGLEGGGIYMLSAPLRDGAPLVLDLAPDLDLATLRTRLTGRGKQSWTNHLRKRLRWDGARIALLHEGARPLPADPAPLIKALPLAHQGLAGLERAISSAGGLRFSALERWQLRDRPSVFCAGEMLDWDAPTGGYLLTACLASGRAAAREALGLG